MGQRSYQEINLNLGEAIVIEQDGAGTSKPTTVTNLGPGVQGIKLGTQAPIEVPVDRQEIHLRKQEGGTQSPGAAIAKNRADLNRHLAC